MHTTNWYSELRMSVNLNTRQGGAETADDATALAVFRTYLAENGMNLTAQRRAVLHEVLSRETHFEVDELCQALRTGGASVSRATVYRTLGHLRDCGLVREMLQCRGRASYEPAVGRQHHDHMVCLRCGKIIEFCDDRIERLQRQICEQHGFRAVDHRLGIRGLCRECQFAARDEGA